LHTVKLNVHPEHCDCPRSPDCCGKFVVNMPDTDTPNRIFRDYDEAEALIRQYALAGPPLGERGVHGPIRTPSHDRLMR
jgi:hypothetical protein